MIFTPGYQALTSGSSEERSDFVFWWKEELRRAHSQAVVGVDPHFPEAVPHCTAAPTSRQLVPSCTVSRLHPCACSKAWPNSCFSGMFPHPVSVEWHLVPCTFHPRMLALLCGTVFFSGWQGELLVWLPYVPEPWAEFLGMKTSVVKSSICSHLVPLPQPPIPSPRV